jgi:predicted acyl esterase
MAATIKVTTDNGDGTSTVATYQVNPDGTRTLISVVIISNDKRAQQ